MIHYRPEVKIGHIDFALRMDMFLPKDSTGKLTSTLRTQKQSESLLPKRTRIPIVKPFNITSNKKQKSNPMSLS